MYCQISQSVDRNVPLYKPNDMCVYQKLWLVVVCKKKNPYNWVIKHLELGIESLWKGHQSHRTSSVQEVHTFYLYISQSVSQEYSCFSCCSLNVSLKFDAFAQLEIYTGCLFVKCYESRNEK